MDGFRIVYLCFGSFVCLAGLSMILIYSLSYPWWRDTVGRMMVTYASAEILMSLILLLAVVAHMSPHWFRNLWLLLQAIVGACFVYQSWTILRLRRNRVSLRKEDHA